MAKRTEIIAVGRGMSDDLEGKFALTMYRSDQNSIAAYNDEGSFVPQEHHLSSFLIEKVCNAVDAYVGEAKYVGNINVYTLNNGIVLKYRQIAGMLREEREHGTPFAMEKLFVEGIHNEDDRKAITHLVETVKNAVKAGCTIRFIDVRMASYIELVVPKGVDIADGTIADFENGKAMVDDVNGVKREVLVRNWEGFARKGAKIVKFRNTAENYPIYALKRTLGASKTKLEAVVSDLWAKCPEGKKATTTQKNTLAGLAA